MQKNIADLERELEALPLLPVVVTRLLALNPDDEDYFDQVLVLAQEDPTFALRIILISNSASSAPANPIMSLQDAIVRIGMYAIAGLVTSIGVMRVFLPSTQGEKNLWIHAIQVAVTSRLIAQEAMTPKVDPNQAYLCGLLHDIGRFVLFDKASDDLNLVEENNWESPKQLVDIEQEIYGFDHSELGGRVCSKWGLPENMTLVVENHHVYHLPEELLKDAKVVNLIRIIQMADFFSMFMMLNPDALQLDKAILKRALQDKCVHPSTSVPPVSVDQLLKLAPVMLEESSALISGLGIKT